MSSDNFPAVLLRIVLYIYIPVQGQRLSRWTGTPRNTKDVHVLTVLFDDVMFCPFLFSGLRFRTAPNPCLGLVGSNGGHIGDLRLYGNGPPTSNHGAVAEFISRSFPRLLLRGTERLAADKREAWVWWVRYVCGWEICDTEKKENKTPPTQVVLEAVFHSSTFPTLCVDCFLRTAGNSLMKVSRAWRATQPSPSCRPCSWRMAEKVRGLFIRHPLAGK